MIFFLPNQCKFISFTSVILFTTQVKSRQPAGLKYPHLEMNKSLSVSWQRNFFWRSLLTHSFAMKFMLKLLLIFLSPS